MAGNVPNRSIVFVSELRRLFDLKDAVFKSRKVEIFDYEGSLGCRLGDFWEKCSDLIADRMAARQTEVSGHSLEDLKVLEAQERVRKLRIDNDEAEGRLVDSGQMKLAYGRKISAMGTILDSAVTRVKKAHPDMPQSALAIIEDCLIEARNAAAGD
jgi:hypothetical protein